MTLLNFFIVAFFVILWLVLFPQRTIDFLTFKLNKGWGIFMWIYILWGITNLIGYLLQ